MASHTHRVLIWGQTYTPVDSHYKVQKDKRHIYPNHITLLSRVHHFLWNGWPKSTGLIQHFQLRPESHTITITPFVWSCDKLEFERDIQITVISLQNWILTFVWHLPLYCSTETWDILTPSHLQLLNSELLDLLLCPLVSPCLSPPVGMVCAYFACLWSVLLCHSISSFIPHGATCYMFIQSLATRKIKHVWTVW